MIQFTIPTIGPSANVFYAGLHPMKRTELARKWHTMVLNELRKQKVRRWEAEYPVDVEIVMRFKKGSRMLDADNCQPTCKLTLDAVVLIGILKDDSPKYVRSVKLIPERSDTGESYTVFKIQKADRKGESRELRQP